MYPKVIYEKDRYRIVLICSDIFEVETKMGPDAMGDDYWIRVHDASDYCTSSVGKALIHYYHQSMRNAAELGAEIVRGKG